MAYLRAYPVAATNSSRITVFSARDASRYRGVIWSNNSLFDLKLKCDLTLPSAFVQLWVTLLVRQAPVKSKIYRESIRSVISIVHQHQWRKALHNAEEALRLAPGDSYWLTVQQVAQKEVVQPLPSIDMSTKNSGDTLNAERTIHTLPTNRPSQSASALSAPIIKKPIFVERDLLPVYWLLGLFLLILLIIGGIEVFIITSRAQVSNNNAQATATTEEIHATATAIHAAATADTLAKNPDLYHPSGGKLVLYDPLSQVSNWDNRSDSSFGGSCQFTRGSYHVSESQSPHTFHCIAPDSTFSNFAFEVQMKITKGDCGGITFRESQVGMYIYVVCQDGNYYLYRSTPSNIEGLRGNDSSAIHKGLDPSNIIAIVANGSTLDLYVNNQKVDSVHDNTSSDGTIGLIAANFSNPTEVVYSYAKVWVW